MFDKAILLIVFNRPSTTKKVFEAIRNSKPARLYISADAPRPGNTDDVWKSNEVKEIVNKVDWDCEVKYLFQEKNLGCSMGPRSAFTWFFIHEEEGIILEDDCLPHLTFFTFCAEMLDKYRNNEKIISISGNNLGYNLQTGFSYSYSRFMNMWGWATWRRSAQKIDYSIQEWKDVKMPLFTLYKRLRQNIFDSDINWFKYWQHKFDLTITRENFTWWDWQWIYHQIRYKQLSIVPGVNLVQNIGFNADATHTTEVENPAAELEATEMIFPIKHPNKIKADFTYEESNVKWVWCYHKRISFFRYCYEYVRELL